MEIYGYLVGKNSGAMLGLNAAAYETIEAFRKNMGKPDPFVSGLIQSGYNPAVDHLIKSRTGIPPLLNVQLNLTWACNLNCLHCYVSDKTLRSAPLSIEEWKTLLKEITEFNVPKVTFLGGEPMLYPGFFELASFASGLGLQILTSTNGVLVTAEIASRFRDSGFTEVDVSLDGAVALSHNYLRNSECFDKTLDGIRNLVHAGLKVKTASVLTKKNIDELESFIKLGRDLGVSHMYFNNIVPDPRKIDQWRELHCSVEQIAALKRRIAEVNEETGEPWLFSEMYFLFGKAGIDMNGQVPSEYAGCKAGKREMIITPEGDSVPCPLLVSDKRFRSGNIRNSSLEELWESDAWMLTFRAIRPDTLETPKCRACRHVNSCNGGCHVLPFLKGGSIFDCDPRCPHDPEAGIYMFTQV